MRPSLSFPPPDKVYGVTTSREGGLGGAGLADTHEFRSGLGSGERSRGARNGNEAALTAMNSWTQSDGGPGEASLPARPTTASKQRARDRLALGPGGGGTPEWLQASGSGGGGGGNGGREATNGFDGADAGRRSEEVIGLYGVGSGAGGGMGPPGSMTMGMGMVGAKKPIVGRLHGGRAPAQPHPNGPGPGPGPGPGSGAGTGGAHFRGDAHLRVTVPQALSPMAGPLTTPTSPVGEQLPTGLYVDDALSEGGSYTDSLTTPGGGAGGGEGEGEGASLAEGATEAMLLESFDYSSALALSTVCVEPQQVTCCSHAGGGWLRTMPPLTASLLTADRPLSVRDTGSSMWVRG